MTVVIVCNGNIRDYTYYRKYFDKAEYIISVDGGASHMRKFCVEPDLMLGDFDSIKKEDFEYYKSKGIEIMEFPPEKDMTDTELAVEIAAGKGFDSVIFIGATGTRLDHSLSNILLLRKMLARGIKGLIVDEFNEITLIDDKIDLEREEGVKVTLLPLTGKIEGVTTEGLYYPLRDATIEMGSSWGVSNEFKEDTAGVTIKKGLMLVIKSRD